MENKIFATREENMVALTVTQASPLITRKQLIALLINSGMNSSEAKSLLREMSRTGLIAAKLRNTPAKRLWRAEPIVFWNRTLTRPSVSAIRSHSGRLSELSSQPFQPSLVIQPARKLLGLLGLERASDPPPESLLSQFRMNELMVHRAAEASFSWNAITTWMTFDFRKVCVAAVQRQPGVSASPVLLISLLPVRVVDIQLLFDFLVRTRVPYEVY
jgi:hypothetical protein